MRKIYLYTVLASLLSIQPAFADDAMSPEGKQCGVIAKACLKAGYKRNANDDKHFWMDCMKPAILGKSVKGLNIDATTSKTCREDKIKEMKQELNDFESVSSN